MIRAVTTVIPALITSVITISMAITILVTASVVFGHVNAVVPFILHKIDPLAASVVLPAMPAPVTAVTWRHV
jgi:hypothetical protein